MQKPEKENDSPATDFSPSLDYIACVMGFEYDKALPINCLHPDCFVEKLIVAAEEELARSGWC